MHSPTITRPRTSDPLPPGADPGVDRERFAALYARHRDELARYCRSILRHDQDVEDALQSTMTKAFAALRTETREIALRPWLFRIAHNEAISIVRRRVEAVELDDRDGGDPDPVPDAVETRERLRQLREDLGDLPQRQRSALVLRELSGLGHREIADVLGTSPSAVKQAIYEARCALGECAAGRSLTCDRVRRALSDGDGRTAARRRLRAHLRSCRSCRAFDAALRQRPQDLGALFPAGPAVAAGGAVAGLSGLVAGTGGGAVGAGSATVGVGATTIGAAASGSGGLLGGALASAGVGKRAGIAAVAAIAGGGAVAVERGTFASPASDSPGVSAVVREASAASGPALRFAAATGGSTAHPVVTPLPGGRPAASEATTPESRSGKRGAAGTTPAASRPGRSDRSAADTGASAPGPAKRAGSAANGRSPGSVRPNRGTTGRPADAGRRRGAAAAQSARTTSAGAAKPARGAIKRSPAKEPQAPTTTGQGAGSAPPAASGSTGPANGAAPGKGNGSDGAPMTVEPPNAASPTTGSSGKVAAPAASTSAGPTGD